MTQYYFVASALPPLQIGIPPEISFADFIELLNTNLNKSDHEKVDAIRRYFDIENLRSLWEKEPLEPYGNFDENELEDAVLTGVGLPAYVYDFMHKYEGLESRLHHFPFMLVNFFNREIERNKGFLKKYFQFERDLRLVLSAFRAKRLGWDLAQELQFEDPTDDLIAQMMAQKDAKAFEPPVAYEELKILFEENVDDPMALHKALTEHRFNKIEQLLGVDVFSEERIEGYAAQLIMAEKWMELDRKEGMEIVDTIVKEAI